MRDIKNFETRIELLETTSNLIQNRLAYIQLIKLDPTSNNFNSEKSALVNTINKTNELGLSDESEKVRKFYENQRNLLGKVWETSSYEDGIKILKSDESISTLVSQTNLILEFQRLSAQLKE